MNPSSRGASQAELSRLDKTIAKTEASLNATRAKLANEGFVARAPEEVVETEREREAQMVDDLVRLRASRVRIAEIGQG